ncbi:unnamed protein product [Polarella glacialis]|uniref:Uncharacterized protein n=1 Tax=Polarella glacialis TaxID=89957 RepID=A0A813K9E1_POLGL|nr:unnamed protein product [Polarella glacialis]
MLHTKEQQTKHFRSRFGSATTAAIRSQKATSHVGSGLGLEDDGTLEDKDPASSFSLGSRGHCGLRLGASFKGAEESSMDGSLRHLACCFQMFASAWRNAWSQEGLCEAPCRSDANRCPRSCDYRSAKEQEALWPAPVLPARMPGHPGLAELVDPGTPTRLQVVPRRSARFGGALQHLLRDSRSLLLPFYLGLVSAWRCNILVPSAPEHWRTAIPGEVAASGHATSLSSRSGVGFGRHEFGQFESRKDWLSSRMVFTVNYSASIYCHSAPGEQQLPTVIAPWQNSCGEAVMWWDDHFDSSLGFPGEGPSLAERLIEVRTMDHQVLVEAGAMSGLTFAAAFNNQEFARAASRWRRTLPIHVSFTRYCKTRFLAQESLLEPLIDIDEPPAVNAELVAFRPVARNRQQQNIQQQHARSDFFSPVFSAFCKFLQSCRPRTSIGLVVVGLLLLAPDQVIELCFLIGDASYQVCATFLQRFLMELIFRMKRQKDLASDKHWAASSRVPVDGANQMPHYLNARAGNVSLQECVMNVTFPPLSCPPAQPEVPLWLFMLQGSSFVLIGYLGALVAHPRVGGAGR